MRDNWRIQFQRKTAGYEQPAADISWSEIDKAVGARRAAYLNSGRYMFAVWTRRAAAAAVLLLVCAATVFYVSEKNTMLISMGQTGNEGISSTPKPAGNIPSSPLLADNIPTKARRHSPSAAVPSAVYSDEAAADSAIDTGREVCPEEQITEVSSNFGSAKTPAISKRLTAKAEKSSVGRISAAVYVQNITGGSLNTGGTGNQRAFMSPMEDMAVNSFMSVGYSEDKIADADHDTPLRLGISVRYHIDDRWSIESGMVYSYLRSTLETTGGSSFTQKLRYVGVPLTASYSVWRNSHVNAYVSAGAMAEMLADGEISGGADGTLSSNRLQWSLSATAGIEYNFNKTFGIYAEPGVRYYPDNHDDIINIYKDKPWNFNLSVGFRVNFK